MRCLLVACAVLVASSISAGTARAEPAAVPAADATANDLISRPLLLEPGALVARLTIEASLETGHFARPLSLAPDVWLGVLPRLTVGLVHSNASVDLIDAGASLCLRAAGACSHVYRGSGLDALWSWLAGPLAVAPRVRLLVRDVDPWKPATTVGAFIHWHWHHGRYAITGDPYLRLGLANRDLGNRTTLVIPLWLAVQPATGWRIALHTGWDSELATWRDGWHIPIGLELTTRVTDQLAVGLTAGFAHLLGPQNNAKARSMAVSLEYRP